MQNIDIVLQTVFKSRFSQAGLDSVACDVLLMTGAICFPVVFVVITPVVLVVAVIAQVLTFPAIVAAFLPCAFTCAVAAGDLTVAEARMGKEFLLAERTEFFFVSSLRMTAEKQQRQRRMWICGKVDTTHVDRALPCPQAS